MFDWTGDILKKGTAIVIFALVCATFTARTNVPWMICNRWNICLNYCNEIRFRVTHIFHEGNVCVGWLI